MKPNMCKSACDWVKKSGEIKSGGCNNVNANNGIIKFINIIAAICGCHL